MIANWQQVHDEALSPEVVTPEMGLNFFRKCKNPGAGAFEFED